MLLSPKLGIIWGKDPQWLLNGCWYVNLPGTMGNKSYSTEMAAKKAALRWQRTLTKMGIASFVGRKDLGTANGKMVDGRR